MAFLRRRINTQGVTFITGRPLIGKSRLLTELRERLRAEGRILVGYARGAGASVNVLLHATRDLYEHWLTGAKFTEQIRSLLQRHKGQVRGRVGIFLGKLLSEAAGPVVGDVFSQVFEAIERVGDDLRSGALSVRPMAVDEARDLLNVFGEHQLLLILDQWEGTGSLEENVAALQGFLDEPHGWPCGLHIVAHVRQPDPDQAGEHPAFRQARLLCERSAAASMQELDRLRIDDPQEEDVLFCFLSVHVPAVGTMKRKDVLHHIDGNPGVLARWTECGAASEQELREEAERAHRYQYPEMRTILEALIPPANANSSDFRPLHVALRLALAPDAPSERAWHAVREAFLALQR